jgi:hypothetical protein
LRHVQLGGGTGEIAMAGHGVKHADGGKGWNTGHFYPSTDLMPYAPDCVGIQIFWRLF